MNEYEIAEINIARMKGININDPVMKEFVDNLDKVNALAESSDGFVWRLKDENNNATNLNPFNDQQVIVNVSVWKDIEALENFMYKTFHAEFLKRRREWFQQFGKIYTALWWIPKSRYPTVEEAISKLIFLQKNGSSQAVFGFKKKFLPPR